MKSIVIMISLIISVLGNAQTEEYNVVFDQLLLKLNNHTETELSENSDFYLDQIITLWPKVKNKLYMEIEWDKYQNRLVRDIDLYINVLKRSIEMQNVEYSKAISFKILFQLKTFRNELGYSNYPIDLLLVLQSKYQNINKVVHDQKLDLLEWMEFQDLVDDFIDTWEQYNCLNQEEIEFIFPHLDKELHQEAKTQFDTCLDNFVESLQSGFRTDFELPCEDLGDALGSLSQLYQFNFDLQQKL